MLDVGLQGSTAGKIGRGSALTCNVGFDPSTRRLAAVLMMMMLVFERTQSLVALPKVWLQSY